MKTLRLILGFIIASLIFTGCFLKSVHPLISPEDSIVMEGLEGRWQSDDQRWTFINDFENFPELTEGENADIDEELFPPNAYIVLFEKIQSIQKDTTIFLGTVGEIGGFHFLDLKVVFKSVGDMDLNDDFIESHYFPVHSISKVTVENDQLNIEFFEDQWITELIASNRVRIKHEQVDDDVLITASTKELQKFVEKYADDEEAFDDPIGMNRITFEEIEEANSEK